MTFQASFHRTKKKLEESPEERQFEFSEMYIFGKFDAFSKRLEKIMHMFELKKSYMKLGESKIEGIERYSTRLEISNMLFWIKISTVYDSYFFIGVFWIQNHNIKYSNVIIF